MSLRDGVFDRTPSTFLQGASSFPPRAVSGRLLHVADVGMGYVVVIRIRIAAHSYLGNVAQALAPCASTRLLLPGSLGLQGEF